MSPSSRRTRRDVLGAGTALVGALAGCSLPSEESVTESTEQFDADVAAATVTTRNGDVRVESGTSDQIVVDVTKRTRHDAALFEDVSVTAERDADTLSIASSYDGVDESRVAVDLAVSLPEGVSLSRAETVNGDASAAGVSGHPHVETTNGDTSAVDVDGYVTLASRNGDVDAVGVGGLDGATTVNGDVTADVPAVRGSVTVETTNGDVSLSVGDVDARILATATNGEVTATELSLSDASESQTRVAGSLGEGTHDVEARATNGDVSLRSLD